MPYAIFSYTALVPWTYFSSALTAASGSLISSSGMLTKVYFPRLIIPIAPVLSKLDTIWALKDVSFEVKRKEHFWSHHEL